MTEFPLRQEPGWVGAFTRAQVPGAIENGTKIVKVKTEAGDANKLGTKGTVLGSFMHADGQSAQLFYFVEWATARHVACGVIGWKIERAP